ncbi:MAG: ABC transporter ATP-binding protein [Dongiaceae bacterium]
MSTADTLFLDRLSHDFGKLRAVDDVEISVGAGEVVCLLGPSGCGKSTVLRLSAGLEALQQGRIWMRGALVGDAASGRNVPPERRQVGLVFQDFALFPHLTVGANVAFGLTGIAAAERQERVREAVAQVGMLDYLSTYPHALSGGQQQRVALARALAPRPSVLLLDEPFSGLDARLREQIREDTLHLLKASGIATMLVTHDPEEAMFMADRIYLMRRGRVEQSGRPSDIYHRPANAFVASFFSVVNELPVAVSAGRVETPFGLLPANGLDDGLPAQLVIRPEAIRFNGHDSTATKAGALVEEVRFLGAAALIRARLTGGAHRGQLLVARLAEQSGAPRAGEEVALSIADHGVFLFVAE